MDEDEKSFWNKNQSELTVADNMKIVGVVMAGMVVIPLAVGMAAGGIAVAAEKLQARRAAKNANKAKK